CRSRHRDSLGTLRQPTACWLRSGGMTMTTWDPAASNRSSSLVQRARRSAVQAAEPAGRNVPLGARRDSTDCRSSQITTSGLVAISSSWSFWTRLQPALKGDGFPELSNSGCRATGQPGATAATSLHPRAAASACKPGSADAITESPTPPMVTGVARTPPVAPETVGAVSVMSFGAAAVPVLQAGLETPDAVLTTMI